MKNFLFEILFHLANPKSTKLFMNSVYNRLVGYPAWKIANWLYMRGWR